MENYHSTTATPVNEVPRKKKKGIRQSKSTRIAFGIVLGVFIVYAIYILYFFVYAFLLSIKSVEVYADDLDYANLFSWPKNPQLVNYWTALSEWGEKVDTVEHRSYLEMTWNSIWTSVGFPLVGAMCTAMVTYILVYYQSTLTKAIYRVGLFVAVLPIFGAGGATYALYDKMNILSTPLLLVTNITLFGGHFFYYYAFWKAIPWEYAEAAEIDGANHYNIFFRVMLPMLLPSATALFLISFIARWNDYSYNLLYLRTYPGLAYGAYAFSETSKYQADMPVYYAGILISLLPVLVLFAIFQNTIMERIHIGGLKG